MQWTFGVSEVTTWSWSFDEDITRYAALGARTIEVWEMKLDPDPQKRRAQLASVAEHGLTVSSFQADVHALFPTHLQPEPQGFDDRFNAFTATLEACAPVIPGAVFVLNTGIATKGDVGAAFERTVLGYGKLARRAADLGVTLALEPLHPLAMNEDSFVWNLEGALEIVDAVGHSALGICADAWNLAGQFALDTRLERCRDKIFVAQVADYRRPRSFLDRLVVGDGSIDFAPFFAGLRAARYRGPIVLEIFSRNVPDSLYDGDLDAVISRSRDAVARYFGEPPR
jgi:sugar phosphate isomerase/epimerase